MSRFTHPYEGARVVVRATGTVPEGPHVGKVVTVTLYDGMASAGYRTNYEHRPRAWLTVRARSADEIIPLDSMRGAVYAVDTGQAWCRLDRAGDQMSKRSHQSRFNGPSDADYMAAARRLHHKDGEVEVDALAQVSRGAPDGAYVAAWVWVPREAATPEPVATAEPYDPEPDHSIPEDHSEPCRECGTKDNPAGGDGWDGLCSSCADKADDGRP